MKRRTFPYSRRCKRCDEVYKATGKYSKICRNCNKNIMVIK
jgi:hypothetical protein